MNSVLRKLSIPSVLIGLLVLQGCGDKEEEVTVIAPPPAQVFVEVAEVTEPEPLPDLTPEPQPEFTTVTLLSDREANEAAELEAKAAEPTTFPLPALMSHAAVEGVLNDFIAEVDKQDNERSGVISGKEDGVSALIEYITINGDVYESSGALDVTNCFKKADILDCIEAEAVQGERQARLHSAEIAVSGETFFMLYRIN